MPKQEKIDSVEQLKAKVGRATALYFVDFTRVTANDFNTVRRRLRETGAGVQVVKNRLAKRATAEAGVTADLSAFLRGPTSLVLAGEDPAAPARAMKELSRKFEALKVKGAYLDSVVYPAERFDFLASLPTKDELRGQLVGALAAPIWDLGLSLERLLGDLVYVLDQLKDRPAPAEPAPAA